MEERIIGALERLAALAQKGIDNMRDRPWSFFLFISIVWGSTGWGWGFEESQGRKKDRDRYEAKVERLEREKDIIADKALNQSMEANKSKDAQIELLKEKAREKDTAK